MTAELTEVCGAALFRLDIGGLILLVVFFRLQLVLEGASVRELSSILIIPNTCSHVFSSSVFL